MTGVVFDFFTQPSYRYINRPYITKVVIAPNRLQQVLTINNLTNVLGQIVKQFELTVRQINIFATLGYRVGIGMNR